MNIIQQTKDKEVSNVERIVLTFLASLPSHASGLSDRSPFLSYDSTIILFMGVLFFVLKPVVERTVRSMFFFMTSVVAYFSLGSFVFTTIHGMSHRQTDRRTDRLKPLKMLPF